MKTAYFNSFSLDLIDEVVRDCSHAGDCHYDVAFWSKLVPRPDACTPAVLALELRESGAWSAEELSDDAANWRRIIWIAACNIREEQQSLGTLDATR